MIAALFLVLALGFGAIAVRWLKFSFTTYEYAAFLIVVGLFGFSWMMFLPSLILPYSLSLPLGAAFTVGSGTILWRYGQTHRFHQLTRGQGLGWFIITTLSAIFWINLMFGHDLLPVRGTLVSAGSTWGDFGVHASLVSHQAAASKLPLDLPVASGTPLTYPPLADFLSALFHRGGWNLNWSLALPGTMLAWSITQLIISLGWRLYGRFGGAVVGMILTLTGGSAAGLIVAISDFRSSGQTFLHWLGNIPQDYTGIASINVSFNNAVSDMLLPQRALLFGLSLWLITAILWHSAIKYNNRRLLFAGAVIVGLLPFAHPHSFLVAGVLFSGLITHVFLTKRDQLRDWLIAAGIMIGLALPQVIWQGFLGNKYGTGGGFTAGWNRMPGQSLPGFEFANFGLLIVVLVIIGIAIWRKNWRQYAPWLAPFLLLFVGAQLYSLQPFAYDNLKLLFYVYLMAMLALGAAIWRTGKFGRWVLVILAVVTFSIPGTLSIIREFELHYVFSSVDDLALANWASTSTSLNAVFATTDIPNQPISTIAGRSIVFGYNGWLYSYHLPYADRETAITSLLDGNFTDPTIALYHPNYLVVSISDSATWTVNAAALATLPQVYANPSWTVYQLPEN